MMDPGLEPLSRYQEDLEANLRLAEALAPTHCTGCNGYHLARARRRLKAGSPDALDRPDMIRLLRHGVGHAAGRPFDILIAGSGDTNLLATCAEAVSNAGGARYIVLDRCRTPLALCEAFAGRHGLDVRTRQVDMASPKEAFAADVIVVHSLLRFLPQASHLGAMVALRQWLKSDGTIIFSHRLMADAAATDACYVAEYRSIEPVMALLAEAGLQVVSLEESIEQGGPRHRLLALLKPI